MSSDEERRFKISIYADVMVLRTENLEHDRFIARQVAEEIRGKVQNSYVGGVGLYTGNLFRPLDQEI